MIQVYTVLACKHGLRILEGIYPCIHCVLWTKGERLQNKDKDAFNQNHSKERK